MNQYLVYSVGFLAQLLFSARQLTQWIASERAGRILSPLLFWQLSILASFLLMVYGILRHDLAINKIPPAVRALVLVFPAVAIGWLLLSDTYNFPALISNKDIPVALMVWGIMGQFVFTFRFIYQWIYSEKRQESLLPIGFWIISITGSLMVLTYAIARKDPVLFLGQLFGVLVYGRNIILGLRSRRPGE
jgi:lipid-A-disaccharide synthase-like uncharacterized protein